MTSMFWKSVGVAVTDMQLPPGLLALIKRTLGDDMHSLKYVTFSLPHKAAPDGGTDELFGIMDIAKQYSLNHVEFSSACRVLTSQVNSRPSVEGNKAEVVVLPKRSRLALPHPKRGLVLFRRDPRRKGSCCVISVADDISTVRWKHNGKLTKVATQNLRNHRLFSLSRLF